MKFKTKLLCDRFTSIISQWPGVECIDLNEAALPDTLDPYFALILDIYYNGSIPEAEERNRLYGDDVAAFETDQGNQAGTEKPARQTKDRFLIGDIPVRLEFKSVGMIEELADIADSRLDLLWFIKDSGTYGFYRLARGEILYNRNGWILGLRRKLDNLSDGFWQIMRNAHQSKMEHFLSDLGAAIIQGDDFYSLITAAGFIKSACLTLFCINRCFEPSHRAYYKQTLDLRVLPESFKGLFENFLHSDPAITMERKFSLAQLIARGIVAL
ncbi:MAG: DUF4037 domain-containing protein [Treponema sp.]|jgi:hypothetical protein|nr:DUF4037 domain-containing protein [Treponema sp.]